MKITTKSGLWLLLSASVLLAGCDDDDGNTQAATETSADSGYTLSKYGKPQLCPQGVEWASEAQTQQVLFDAGDLSDGGTLTIAEGCYKFESEIVFDGRQNITIQGEGIDKTFLDFSDSTAGEGISIVGGTNITIQDLQVSEAAKNAIKATGVNGLIIRDVAAIWMEVPRAPEAETGAIRGTYALYPVSSENVLIEDTWSYGSADAGVYVGQSKNVIVRNNVAEANIAGIEIENTENADVYNNLALGNTGGLLVFDLPGAAAGTDGDPTSGNISKNVRLFNNIVRDNNLVNYVKEDCQNDCGFAGGVHIVPPGTGVIVLSARETEIYNNTITNHDTVAVAITSYLIAEPDMTKYIPGAADEGTAITFGWNPVPTGIYVHDNLIESTGAKPNGDLIEEMIAGYQATQGSFPHVLYDGIGEVVIKTGQVAFDTQSLSVAFKKIADGLEAAAAGSALDGLGFWNYLWRYSNDDRVCIKNNILDVTVGSVYDGNDVVSFMDDADAYTAAPALLYEQQGKLLDCELTPQIGASAAIGSYIYRYAGDTEIVN